MKERLPAILLIMGLIAALILNSRGQLYRPSAEGPSVAGILFAPSGTEGVSQSGWTYAAAFFGYLITVSFLNESEALWLTGLLALAALMFNAKNHPEGGVIPILFGKDVGSAGASQPNIQLPDLGNGIPQLPDVNGSHSPGDVIRK